MKKTHLIALIAASMMVSGPVMAQQVQQLFIFPKEGQSEDQLNQDKAECEMWTYEQIGFPQGYEPEEDAGKGKVKKNAAIGTVAGAGIGAAAGAAAGKPGKGAAVGAGAGLIGGLIVGSKKKEKAREEAEEQANAVDEQYNENYRRAMTACLTARGYTVS